VFNGLRGRSPSIINCEKGMISERRLPATWKEEARWNSHPKGKGITTLQAGEIWLLSRVERVRVGTTQEKRLFGGNMKS